MTQTNVVPIDQKQERAPHLRNIDLTVEQQLSDLEIRLQNQMATTQKQAATIERYRNDLNLHINTWNSMFRMMQISNPDIVTTETLDDAVSDCIYNNSDVVSQDDLEDKVKDSISELTFSVTVE